MNEPFGRSARAVVRVLGVCGAIAVLGIPATLHAQDAAASPATERAKVRVLSATRHDSLVFLTGGSSRREEPRAGKWLVIGLEVTAPREDLVTAPALTGAGASPSAPKGITGDSAAKEALVFLEYSSSPSFVPGVHITGHSGWVGLTSPSGAYAAAAYLGADDKMAFALLSGPKLSLQKTSPVALTLAFDVSGVQGPYSLDLGGTQVAVRPAAARGEAR